MPLSQRGQNRQNRLQAIAMASIIKSQTHSSFVISGPLPTHKQITCSKIPPYRAGCFIKNYGQKCGKFSVSEMFRKYTGKKKLRNFNKEIIKLFIDDTGCFPTFEFCLWFLKSSYRSLWLLIAIHIVSNYKQKILNFKNVF